MFVDVYCKFNPRGICCTWSKSFRSQASRLNRFFVSQFKCCSNNFLPCVYSNDDFVLLRLSLDGFSNRRSCIWKFNTRVLSDPSFMALITDLIHQHKLKTAALPSLPFGTGGVIFKKL